MRVGFLVDSFPVLSETFILSQMRGLLERGHDVRVFALRRGDRTSRTMSEWHPFRSRVRYAPSFPANRLLRVSKAVALLLTRLHRSPSVLLRCLSTRAHGRDALSLRLLYSCIPFLPPHGDLDALVCHFGPLGLLGDALRRAGACSGKLIVAFHGYDLSIYLRRHPRGVYSHLFENADLLLPVCDRWRRLLLELGAPGERVVVHPMGVDNGLFAFAPLPLEDGQPLRVLSVARLVEKKGLEYGIRAVCELLGRGVPIDYRIVGDGPLAGELTSLARRLGAGPAVRLLGALPPRDVRQALRSSHVLLAPSIVSHLGDEDGIPVALMEAMASGVAVVSTLHSGIPELVADGVSGLLVEEGNVEQLVAALQRLLDGRALQRLREAARRVVEARFDLRALDDRYAQLLGCAQPTRHRPCEGDGAGTAEA